jgi:transaldolase
VTLIFSLERYAAVKEAFLRGLEERKAAGLPIDRVASVASFFVSRVDTNIDARLDAIAKRDPARATQAHALQGKAAVANAKLAYRQFQAKFSGSRWEALVAAGARVQRPLWASTSTKNPAYPDLIYVDTLMGPHTVNTMPPATIEGFRDHGVVARTIDQGLEQAEADLEALEAIGVSMREVTDELEAEGVQKFSDSFAALLQTIETRRREIAAA